MSKSNRRARPPSARSARSPLAAANGGYISGPFFDWFFFISAPLLALVLGWGVKAAGGYGYFIVARDSLGNLKQLALPVLLSAVVTHAHLAIVFFRSHLNKDIFKRHRYRFTVVPLTLLVASIASQWVFVIVSVVAVWWDVYHSSLQTFGLGRIYDKRAGNDLAMGRRADYLFNLVLFVVVSDCLPSAPSPSPPASRPAPAPAARAAPPSPSLPWRVPARRPPSFRPRSAATSPTGR